MLLKEIKEKWLKFFVKNGYFKLEELSLVPSDDDNSILWINSGVSALKKYFINPDLAPSNDMVNSQRVIRTNDIDKIDEKSYHQTLFEMLGCFSIDGKFKKDIIPLIWSFFTNTENLAINPRNLFITVLREDFETLDTWNKQPNLLKKNIVFCDRNTNFWDMGEGPCGPNTEIYYCFDPLNVQDIDLESKNFLEIGNLVFSDIYHSDSGYFPLEKKCVDVGVGLERLAIICQNVSNSFEIDIWKKPILFLKNIYLKKNNYIKKYEWKINVVVDHIRTFIIAVFDGVFPSSKHRGYIIRKLIKKSFWISYFLGISVDEINELSSIIIKSNSHFSGIFEKQEEINQILNFELQKISKDSYYFEQEIKNHLQGVDSLDKKISSEKIFFWYDTLGIPIDFIRFFLTKNGGFFFEEDSFLNLLDKQKKKSLMERKNKNISVF